MSLLLSAIWKSRHREGYHLARVPLIRTRKSGLAPPGSTREGPYSQVPISAYPLPKTGVFLVLRLLWSTMSGRPYSLSSPLCWITGTCCLGRHCSGPSGALPVPCKDEGTRRKCREQLVSFDTWIHRGPERGRDLPMSQNRFPADLGP